MTRDEIIKLAREAKVFVPRGVQEAVAIQELERFAALVSAAAEAAEREACAAIVEAEAMTYAEPTWALRIVDRIRARNNT